MQILERHVINNTGQQNSECQFEVHCERLPKPMIFDYMDLIRWYMDLWNKGNMYQYIIIAERKNERPKK